MSGRLQPTGGSNGEETKELDVLLRDVHREDGHTSFWTCSLDQGALEMEQKRRWDTKFQK